MAQATLAEVWEAYRSRPRILTPDVVESIPWEDIDPSKLERVLGVLPYFLQTELSTVPNYLPRSLNTPSGRHPVISQFLLRWGQEEATHGQIFLQIAERCGIRRDPKPIPLRFGVPPWQQWIENQVLREHFIAIHMVWGAANELITRRGYDLLYNLSADPVFQSIVRMIAREESRHFAIYRRFASILLSRSLVTQAVTRMIVGRFWTPVGNEENWAHDTRRAIDFLSPNLPTLEHEFVAHIQSLPGLSGLNLIGNMERYFARLEQGLV